MEYPSASLRHKVGGPKLQKNALKFKTRVLRKLKKSDKAAIFFISISGVCAWQYWSIFSWKTTHNSSRARSPRPRNMFVFNNPNGDIISLKAMQQPRVQICDLENRRAAHQGLQSARWINLQGGRGGHSIIHTASLYVLPKRSASCVLLFSVQHTSAHYWEW